MKNKSGADGLNVNAVSDALPVVGRLLLEIITIVWKTVTVTSIPKMGDSRRCHDLRPINMLPTLEKIIEYKTKEQIEGLIEE